MEAAEGAIEIGEIAEPDIECHRADAAIGKARIAPHPVRASQPPAENEGRKGEPFPLDELVDVTRRHALPLRDRSNGQIAVSEVRIYVGDDRPQSRGTDTAAFGDRPAVSRRADNRRDEIVDVGDDEPLKLGCIDTIRQRLEWLDPCALVELAHRFGARRFRQPVCREPEGGAYVLHSHHR